MTEDEMYETILGYEESERDYHERNIELENENAKLRELLKPKYAIDPFGLMVYENAQLMEENAKLRELVREYAEIANYICEVYNGCGQEYDHCKYDPLNNDMCKLGKLNGRARELGVEVDG